MMDRDSIQDRISGFWNLIASGYEAHKGNVPARDSEEYRAWVLALAEMLPSSPCDVLDVGTGTGFVALITAGLGHCVTAIDLAEPMLTEARTEAARRGASVRFLTGDAVSPELPESSFDALTSRHLIWTLRDPDAALSAWRRLLRPGGRVIAIDGFWFSPLDDSAAEEGVFESYYTRDVRRRLPGWQHSEPGTIVRLFEKAGFIRVRVRMLDEIQRVALNPPSDKPAYAIVGFAG
jgi:ubiquinone/menaquinone biosynthesis C-methylase UbiE